MLRKSSHTRRSKALAICLSFVSGISIVSSQTKRTEVSHDDLWTRIETETIKVDRLYLPPKVFRAFQLNVGILNSILRTAPMEFRIKPTVTRETIITLPTPTGAFGRFAIEESPIIAPKLAQRYPWLKSYKAKGLDDRTATGRFEFTPEGFHAMVISASGTFFVDAASKQDPSLHISYFKADLPPDPSTFRCYVDSRVRKPIRVPRQRQPKVVKHHAAPAAGDSDLRIYRLAVAASDRYVEAIHRLGPGGPSGDPATEALMAIHRTIDRVNEIYETELGVRLELIGDEPAIIYPDPKTDPYDDTASNDALLDLNQTNIDDTIGWDNYDVGHLFLARGGGLADNPCACNDWFKAEALTGRENPQGDAFDVDYVAHELGHQFGARHSFNGTTGGCQFRSADTAYEPGSGSTIMAYASASRICGDENVQNQSDDYFHAISLKEINDFITNVNPGMGDSCARRVGSTNFARPVVDAGGDHVIPAGTPFTLTIASSDDGDGDALVYNWEEFDLGDPDPPQPADPQEPNKIRPLFRSRDWSGDLSRIFPMLSNILDNPVMGSNTFESPPMNNRTMIFRATARDKRGRYGYDDSHIRVVATRITLMNLTEPVGPFKVIQPAGGAVWRRGSRQTVRWSVANTSSAPISCRRVRISLLIKGDETHPIELVKRTLNNGSKTIVVPRRVPLGSARVKVEALANVFFNISEGDLEIRRR